MKTCSTILSEIVALLTVVLCVNAYSQTPDASRFWIVLDDHAGSVETMVFGNASAATYCIDDGSNGTTNYYESLPPPVCGLSPCNVWKGVRTGAGNACRVDGMYPRDYRSIPSNPERRDTFKLQCGNSDIPESTLTLTWQNAAELGSRCDSMFLTYFDPLTFVSIRIDMFTQNRLDIASATIHGTQVVVTIDKFGCAVVDAIEEVEGRLPTEFHLDQNYPNPFNPTTTITYDLPRRMYVSLVVYDLLGREVALLADGYQEPGKRSASFDGSRLSSGIYFYTLRAGEISQTRKISLIK